MGLTLYFLENSRAFRVLWLAKELNVPIQVRNYPRIEGKKAVPEMARDSDYKLGKSPCLIEDDHDGKGEVSKVVESGNCMQYLVERFQPESNLLPPLKFLRARTAVIGWIDFSETLMLHALAIVYPEWFGRKGDEDAVKNIQEKCSANVCKDLEEVEDTLQANGPYLCGDTFTAADIAVAFSAEYVLVKKIGLQGKEDAYPFIKAWLRKIEARPAYQETLKDGAKHDFCLLKQSNINVREVNRINEKELELAVEGGASWHDDYKDSAYIFVGNLDKRLTEGDVITIFSQYGEVMDINLPRIPEGGLRDKSGEIQGSSAEERQRQQQRQSQQQQQAGKPGERRGFGFLLYQDQKSTVLAVDNLNGFNLLERTIRVDHVKDYKMPGAKKKEEQGELVGPSRNAAPVMIQGSASEEEAKNDEEVDLADPMASYIAASKKEKGKRKEEKEDRRKRKEERRLKREERELRKRERNGDSRESSSKKRKSEEGYEQSRGSKEEERLVKKRYDKDRSSRDHENAHRSREYDRRDYDRRDHDRPESSTREMDRRSRDYDSRDPY